MSEIFLEKEKEILKKCLVCESSDNELMYSELSDVTYQTSIDQWSMYRCKKCFSAFLNPRPNEQSIYKAYKNYHTHDVSNLGSSKFNIFLKKTRRSFANGYRNWYFKTKLEPANKIGIIISLLAPRIKENLEAEGRNLSKFKKLNLRILDVGFGGGDFLKHSKEMGWITYGVDTDPVTVENALAEGLTVKHGGIEAFSDKAEFFDVVTISHVIEHVHNPKLLLIQAYKLLKPGGQIWLETPNIESMGHKDFMKNWRGLEAPRHLTIFTWLSLERLLTEVGFLKIERNPRKWLYYSMAIASLKIKHGYVNKVPFVLLYKYWIKELYVNFFAKNNHSESEFITLIAFK